MQKRMIAGVGSEKIIRRRSDGELEYQPDDLTIEEPLEIRVNGKTLAITMRTPGQDDELAVGFLVAESILRDADEVEGLSRPNDSRNAGNITSVRIRSGREIETGTAKRFGTITSSCGICGKESIAAVRQNFSPIQARADVRIDVATLTRLPGLLRKGQSDFDRTGGIHAAGVFDLDGNPRIVREDIGRHNAVDKVIGRAFLDRALPLDRHVLLVSGRASFEIVQKALSAGIPIIASVSAPSTLAVEFCRENNQTLIGFLRPPSFNLYSHVERVILESPNG
jgi:FdhD protein